MKIDAVQLAGLLSYVAKAADVDTADSLAGHIAALEQQLEASMSPPSALVALQIVKVERDAALADNAELTRAIRLNADCSQGCMECGMIGHHFLECVTGRVARAAHPGAALLEVVDLIRQYRRQDEPNEITTLRRLLEERLRITAMIDPDMHRKALVRARNGGLEEAATFLERHRNSALLAQEVRAMKEPE